MKVLAMTAMWPTPENPAFGSFVRSQVEALKYAGVEVEVLVLQGRPRKLNYLKAPFQLRRRLAADPTIDLVHAHYGLVGIVARTQFRVPLVVTYHGSDVLGAATVEEKAAKQIDFVKKSYEAAIANTKELTELYSKGHTEAFAALSHRVSELTEEVKAAIAKK